MGRVSNHARIVLWIILMICLTNLSSSLTSQSNYQGNSEATNSNFIDTQSVNIYSQSIPIFNFSNFDGSGFSSNPSTGMLNSSYWAITGFSDGDLPFGGNISTGDYARGIATGSVTTSGVYAFDVASNDYILGIKPSSADFTPGTITLRIENEKNMSISQVDLANEIWVYNDQNIASLINLTYSQDGINYNSVPKYSFYTPQILDTPASWTMTQMDATITQLDIPQGGFIYLRWTSDDFTGTGSRDEFGFDDINVTLYSYVETQTSTYTTTKSTTVTQTSNQTIPTTIIQNSTIPTTVTQNSNQTIQKEVTTTEVVQSTLTVTTKVVGNNGILVSLFFIISLRIIVQKRKLDKKYY